MRILIPTMGTRGDIQPYVALGQALAAAGHHPTIATHPCWENLVRQYGLDFTSIGPDVNIEHEAAFIRGAAKHWVQGMIRTMKFMFRIIEDSSFQIKALCEQADLVIASHSHIGASEAEACGTPYISVTLQPTVIPKRLEEKGAVQRAYDLMVGMIMNPMMVGPYNKLRKKLEVPSVRTFYDLVSPHLNLIPISSSVYPTDRFWEPKNLVTGYWFVEDSSNYEPPQDLLAFLNAGEPPIIISLGAMSFESKEERSKAESILQAVVGTGMRAVIQGFDVSLANYPLPANCFKAGSVSHSWLFPQAYAIIHHGGFGTTASALKAGVPSIVVPHALDQYEWANRVHDLQCGPKSLPASKLSAETLTETIRTLQANYETISSRARQISQSIQEENGLQKAVCAIEATFGSIR